MAQPASGTLLVVEDDEQVRELVRLLLEHEGYTVRLTGDAASARAAYDEEEHILLVVVDRSLPDGDGFELGRSLAAADRALGVVYLSGGGQRPPPASPREAYVSKPFRADDLLEAVRRVLAP